MRRGEHCGGFFGDPGAFEEARVLRAPQARLIGEGEDAEIAAVMRPSSSTGGSCRPTRPKVKSHAV